MLKKHRAQQKKPFFEQEEILIGPGMLDPAGPVASNRQHCHLKPKWLKLMSGVHDRGRKVIYYRCHRCPHGGNSLNIPDFRHFNRSDAFSRDCFLSARLPWKSAVSMRKSQMAVDEAVHIRGSFLALPVGWTGAAKTFPRSPKQEIAATSEQHIWRWDRQTNRSYMGQRGKESSALGCFHEVNDFNVDKRDRLLLLQLF